MVARSTSGTSPLRTTISVTSGGQHVERGPHRVGGATRLVLEREVGARHDRVADRLGGRRDDHERAAARSPRAAASMT